jgi:hypothetical protein
MLLKLDVKEDPNIATINFGAPIFAKASFLQVLAVLARSAWQPEIFFSPTYSVGSRSTNFKCLDSQTLNAVGYPLCTKVLACMLVVETFSNPAELCSNSVKR